MTAHSLSPARLDPKKKTAFSAFMIFAGMLALGFASPPLYRMFCEVTGLGGTTQKSTGENAKPLVGRQIEVRFDANRAPTLPWTFRPETTSQTVTIGERNMTFFVATNNARYPVKGTATFNVTPDRSGKYFSKIQCFCFQEQVLQPGETMRMPVIYYVDPTIVDDLDARDISAITLSYTFYPMDDPRARG
jgi:cytochrome c oxidase assembly protein subunit 11